MEQLHFELITTAQVCGMTRCPQCERARVPGGWIVIYDAGTRIKFCPEVTCGSAPGPKDPGDRQPELRLVA